MRIRNLSKVYVYFSKKGLNNGEYLTSWYLKSEEWLNAQQDLNELNRNSSGVIDYENIKLRIDREVNIDKGDGISFNPLQVDENNMVINDDKPDYLVENKPKIGRTTLFTLVTNNGE